MPAPNDRLPPSNGSQHGPKPGGSDNQSSMDEHKRGAILLLAGPPLVLGLLWVGSGVAKLLGLAQAEGWGTALRDSSSWVDLVLGLLLLGVASACFAATRRAQAEGAARAGPPAPAGSAAEAEDQKAPSLASYLFDKRGELTDLELKDAVMTKAIVDVHRHRTSKSIVAVPLFALHPIHVIDRESAIATTEQRARELAEHADELRAAGTLTVQLLAEHLPSVSMIKAVPVTLGSAEPEAYLAFEGNGRIAALQATFTPDDDLSLEVERYDVDEPEKVLRRLNRVRRLNGLTSLEPR
ncbi:MAG: hypothetical protein P1V81_05680 [Planctomycetota bacterium]|nr:hypothetical protein [Planctomycetota bacterium]